MLLSKQIGKVVDKIFNEEDILKGFSKIKGKDGISFRSYYEQTDYSEREISVYREKYWSKNGGRIYAELFCFIPEIQIALSGVKQSWRDLNYNLPIHHLQYRLSGEDNDLEWTVRSSEDIEKFELDFRLFLQTKGLDWFNDLNNREGCLRYYFTKKHYFYLAKLFAHFGDRKKAKECVLKYINKLPRQIESNLENLVKENLISIEDKTFLKRASIQSNDDYRNMALEWIKNFS